MTNGGDAAEMLVRLYLEGFEEVVKLIRQPFESFYFQKQRLKKVYRTG